MTFVAHKLIRFQHCDPAGIVFYPQYFYLLHEVQEDFLSHIGFPEHELIHGGSGLPIVDLKTRFVGMCRHGDSVAISLDLTRIGNASLGMHYEIRLTSPAAGAEAQLKLEADATVVYMNLRDGRAAPFPEALRQAMTPFLKQAATSDA
jgi:4-hydroxybenzoyl-CoA thioesterase